MCAFHLHPGRRHPCILERFVFFVSHLKFAFSHPHHCCHVHIHKMGRAFMGRLSSCIRTGWLPNVQRAVAVNVGQLVAYDRCKQLLLHHSLPDGTACHALASLGAGVCRMVGTSCGRGFTLPSRADIWSCLYFPQRNCSWFDDYLDKGS